MTARQFEIEVDTDTARRFAELSGDWNPLHTDEAYAADTEFGSTILHGAFGAGLLSQMAGMLLPGRDCLLQGMTLKFHRAIGLPARLLVRGELRSGDLRAGRVEGKISDSESGVLYISGSYTFGSHTRTDAPDSVTRLSYPSEPQAVPKDDPGERIVVTGASGGLGGALCDILGDRAIPVSRGAAVRGGLGLEAYSQLTDLLDGHRVSAIVHCASPPPDNDTLLSSVDEGTLLQRLKHNLLRPVEDAIVAAQALSRHGIDGALLLLIGSVVSRPGRHMFRSPAYSLQKSLVPTLVQVLSHELSESGQRVVGVEFDVLEGGMSRGMSSRSKILQANRFTAGRMPQIDEAAQQLVWVLENPNWLVSGTIMTLNGGGLP